MGWRSDGVIGLEQIKAEGGITFAQTEGTAGFPTLPHNAFLSGCVDFVLPPDAIAAELRRIAKHPLVFRAKAIPGDGEPQSDLHRIFAMLRALNGGDFSYYKHSTLKRRIMRRMVLRKIESLNRYVTYLQQNPAEVALLFHDLLINVTSFFRDPEVFAALRRRVFPKLAKNGQRNRSGFGCRDVQPAKRFIPWPPSMSFSPKIPTRERCRFLRRTSATMPSSRPARAFIPRALLTRFLHSVCADFSSGWTMASTRSLNSSAMPACSPARI